MGWISGGTADTLAVHAALLPNNQIIYFGGSDYNPDNFNRGLLNHTRLYDCSRLTVSVVPSPETDTFCCGQSLIEGGLLVIAGGTASYPQVVDHHGLHWPGIRDTWIFDWVSSSWRHAAYMNLAPPDVFAVWDAWKATHPGAGDSSSRENSGGRWYPTLVTLADGGVLAMSGHPSKGDPRHCNNTPEIYSFQSNEWTLLPELLPGDFARLTDSLQLVQYPRLHLLPNGDLFCVTPLQSLDTRIQSSLRYNVRSHAYSYVGGELADPDYQADAIVEGHNTTSVLLPYLRSQGYRSQVLLCGAAQALRIDLDSASPVWHPTSPRTLAGSPPRYNLNAVLLPTGDVFVSGGVSDRENKLDSSGVLTPEIYHPETDRWETLEVDQVGVVRNYHSVALLMPDGRVWTAGSNKDGKNSVGDEDGPGDTHESRIRIYEPWYCSKPRPQILGAPRGFGYWTSPADDFAYRIHTASAQAVARVAIVRAGSVTHAFNSDQRYIELAFRQLDGEVDVTPPVEGGIAPPGYYLLFVIDAAGVPSAGWFVWVGPREPLPGSTSEFLAAVAPNHAITVYRYDPGTNWTAGQITWASMLGPLTNWVVGNVWHLAGIATDENLYVLWQSPGHDWQAANISQMTGARVVGAVTSWIVGSSEFLAGVAADHTIHVYRYDPATNWTSGQIPWSSIAGPLTSWVVGDVWHLAGVATDQNLYVLWQSPGHDWQAANISQMTGARVVGAVTSWIVGTSEFLAGVAADHTIHVYRYDPATNWTSGQIPWSSIAGPLTSWVVGDVWHLAGVATDGNLYVLWQSPGHDWQAANISQMTGARVVGAVTSWVVGDVEHLAGVDADGSVYVFWYSPARNWQAANISQITNAKVAYPPVSWFQA